MRFTRAGLGRLTRDGPASLLAPGFGVDIVFGKRGEQVVIVLFFEEGKLQQLFDLIEVKGARMGCQAAIGGDLVVFEFLGGYDEAGVAGGRSGVGGGDNLFRFVGNAKDRFGGHRFDGLAELAEDAFEPAQLFAGIIEMTGEDVSQPEGGSGLFQQRKEEDLLFFGAIQFF